MKMKYHLMNIPKRFLSTRSGFRPRRSLLYVPGTDEKKMTKSMQLNSDVVVLDCEDGVAVNKKDECRRNIQRILPSLSFQRSELAIRINSIDNDISKTDLESVLLSNHLPDAVMIPKIESKEQVLWFEENCKSLLKGTNNEGKTINVIGQIETPFGLMNIREILEQSKTCSLGNMKFQAFVFGSDDFLAAIGGTRTKDAKELLFARQNFIMHVKGFNFQAIDMVDIEFKDLDGLRKQSKEGALMGFTGKQVIHPNQIDIVNEEFSPTEQQIKRARNLVAAYEEHLKSGKGAFTFEDSMIDMPSVKQAFNILNLASIDKHS